MFRLEQISPIVRGTSFLEASETKCSKALRFQSEHRPVPTLGSFTALAKSERHKILSHICVYPMVFELFDRYGQTQKLGPHCRIFDHLLLQIDFELKVAVIYSPNRGYNSLALLGSTVIMGSSVTNKPVWPSPIFFAISLTVTTFLV